jgi:hypothetical protein
MTLQTVCKLIQDSINAEIALAEPTLALPHQFLLTLIMVREARTEGQAIEVGRSFWEWLNFPEE